MRGSWMLRERALPFHVNRNEMGDLRMDCDRCRLLYGPYGLVGSNKDDAYKNVDTNCPSLKFIRTGVADYYVCHKSGMPNDGSSPGWYSGRGY